MSSLDLQGGQHLEAGAAEKAIIAEIIGGYEAWKAEQLALEGGRRMHRRGGSLEGGEAPQEQVPQEPVLEGGELEGGEGEELEGGKKRGRKRVGKKCKSPRTVKLSCGKGTAKFRCTKVSGTHSRRKSKSRSRSKSRSKSRRRQSPKQASWTRKWVACMRKTGKSPKQAMRAASKGSC